AAVAEAAYARRDLARVVEGYEVNRAVEPSKVLGLQERIVAVAETVVAKTPQRVVAAYVRAAQGLHQVEGHALPRARFAQRQSAAHAYLVVRADRKLVPQDHVEAPERVEVLLQILIRVVDENVLDAARLWLLARVDARVGGEV